MIASSLRQGEPMSVPEPVRPLSRVLRSIAGYGVATALMLVTPMLIVFAPAVLFYCALRNGRIAAWSAAIVAIVLTALYSWQAAGMVGAGHAKEVYSSFLVVSLGVIVPALLTIPLVQNRRKFGVVLTIMLLWSVLGLASTEMIMRTMSFSPYASNVAHATESSNLAIRMADANGAHVTATAKGRAAVWLLTNLPNVFGGLVVFSMALIFVLSLMMFGRLSAWRVIATTGVDETQARGPYLFRDLQWPEWLLFLFIFGGLTPVLSGTAQTVAANALALTISLYMLQGLAVFRSILVRAHAGPFGTIFAFVLLGMLCFAGVGLVLLTGVGLFDPFFDFRKLNRKDDSHESHTD
jgi:hypothetical protein